MSTHLIRRATVDDQNTVVTVLASAFATDPMLTWLMGNPRDPERRLHHFFGHLVGHELAAPDHVVDIVDGGGAAALWHEVDQWRASPLEMVAALPSAVGAFRHRLPRALRTLTMMEKVHPSAPHRYLAFIGVDPSRQGQGLGSALLRSATEELDTQGIGAYLESSRPRNNALYARHGFDDRGPVPLQPGAPGETAMWRDPRS